MSEWTKEPWMRNGKTLQNLWRIDGMSDDVGLAFMMNFTALTRTQEDADRLTACVNALAGIPDPAAAIAQAREALLVASRTIAEPAHPHLLKMIRAALAALEGKP